jgi:proline utilization trans-activator
LIVSVHGLLNDLSSWLHDLPEELRLNLADIDECPNLSREIVSIYLHYFQCITMTARPLLFHVVKNRLNGQLGADNEPAAWRKTLSPMTVAVIDTCISTAIDSTAVINAAAKQNLIGP